LIDYASDSHLMWPHIVKFKEQQGSPVEAIHID